MERHRLLAAALFYAAGTVHIQRVVPDVPPLGTATAAMTVSAIALAPFAGLADLRLPSLATMGWLITLGVGATGGALVLFYALIHASAPSAPTSSATSPPDSPSHTV